MKRDFDPTTLRLYVAACEERSIARAAEREGIVASAISKRLSALESHIGLPLLRRGRRRVETTPAGGVLLRRAREILLAMDRAHAEVVEFGRGVRASVRVLASPSALSEFLPDDVGAFLARHRGVRISLDERLSSEIVRGLHDATADFGVCWDAGDLAGLEMRPYRTDHLCVAVAATHPLARRRVVAFADTLAHEHVEILSGSIVQTTLHRAAAMAGRSLRHRIRVSTFDAACRNVAAGLGLAVVPREAAGLYATTLGLRLVPLADPWAERRFVLCMRSMVSLPAAARRLVEHLSETASDSGRDVARVRENPAPRS